VPRSRINKPGGRKRLFVVPVLLLIFCASAWAHIESTKRTIKGRAGQDIRIGVYASIRGDCKSGPLPTIRLTAPPAHGKVTVKQGKLKATNLRQCLAAEVPAYVVVYRSSPEFTGMDTLTLEVANPNGKTQIQTITVNVGAGAAGEKI
jgi:hypothetical protein